MFISTSLSIEIDTSTLVFGRAEKFACNYCWPISTVPKICLWLLLANFDGPENLLVTIADPFRRSRKFACDYCWPLLTGSKNCSWLLPSPSLSVFSLENLEKRWNMPLETLLKKSKNGKKISNPKYENFPNLSQKMIVINLLLRSFKLNFPFPLVKNYHRFYFSVFHTESPCFRKNKNFTIKFWTPKPLDPAWL